MSRYTGPVEKLERREGISLDLKGKPQLLSRTALELRGAAPPGNTGRGGRGRRASTRCSCARRRS